MTARSTGSIQLPLRIAASRGGSRPGAGRKPSGRRVGVPHRSRPDHKARHPVHVTLRSVIGYLRSGPVFAAVVESISLARRSDFRVVHFSVQANHVHLLVEASDLGALSRGIRGLIIRSARAVNGVLGRAGRVWTGRYHRRDLKTPAEVRNGLVYVLHNWKKHSDGATGVDPRSSGPWFDGWRDHAGAGPASAPRPVTTPRTWLAAEGWRLHGLLSIHESPASGRSSTTSAARA